MKITNKHGLPRTLVNAIERPQRSLNTRQFRVSQLIGSPRVAALSNQHKTKLESDVMDNLWSLLGTGVHRALELAAGPEHIAERRLVAEIDGVQVSGTIDLQIDGKKAEIFDYKVTTVWAVGQPKVEWERQLNAYAWLVRTVKGVEIGTLAIVAIMRNWEGWKVGKEEGYPEYPIALIKVPVWPHSEADKYVRGRIAAHAQARLAASLGDPLPKCSDEDRWKEPDKWALYEKEGKRAKRIYDSEDEAMEAIDADTGQYVVHRPGKARRCEKFCQVAKWCDQWQEERKKAAP